ncbi:MAG: DNA topoisomerase III [Clostridium sp.]
MGKILVLAEKPSVGRELARVLKCRNNKGAFIEGDKYIVTWALGHLVGLMDPEGYGDKYKEWNMETLPMLPSYMKLTVLKKTGKQFNEVKRQLLRADVNEIVIATDAGREGELVARWIIEKVGVKKPIKRLWISSQTDKAIIEGFKNLKPGANYENLYKAAVCRAEADWIVGLNATRALTCKYNAQLSAGRVQSPTLSIIVEREEEIRKFVPKKFYTVGAGDSNGVHYSFKNKSGEDRFWNKEEAEKIKNKLSGSGKIIDVIEKEKREFSPALYDLTELQRDCNRLYGFTPKQTLNIMQRLYENYKILTYPRTDSRYISDDIVGTLKDRIKAVAIGENRLVCDGILKDGILKDGIRAGKHFVDNNKVSDHHAIIPTEERGNVALLSSDERKVYELVVKRFLSVMLPPYVYIETKIKAEVNGEALEAKGKVVKDLGFKKLYKSVDKEESQKLPKINKGDEILITFLSVSEGETLPPQRFTEASLLSAMENPQKYVSLGKDASKTLNETGGLGTVATRADIIEKLFNSFVIEKKDKYIVPTSKGKQLIELVPKELKSPLLTAKWEKRLEEISKGNGNPKDFVNELKKYASSLVEEIKHDASKFVHDNKTGKKCPNCGKYLLEVKGKNGTLNVCQDRECGYRENVARTTNARCPECKKRLELRGKGDGQIYVCVNTNCNFREKASVFNKRFDKKSDKVNKKEVNNLMKKMKKEAEEEMNNPFADLLKGFNK